MEKPGVTNQMKIVCLLLTGYIFFLVTGCKEKDPRKNYGFDITTFSNFKSDELPHFQGKDMQPVWPETRDTQNLRKLLPFTMKDQKDKTISDKDLLGNITVISFFFTRCSGICPTITNNLSLIQNKFISNNTIRILSFSVTPDLDTTASLSTYATARNINYDKWRLVTGNKKEIYTLARESFNADTVLYRENKKETITENDFLHSENIYLLDTRNDLRGIYNGKAVSAMNDLIADIELLKKE